MTDRPVVPPRYPCCRCCGFDDPEYAEVAFWVRTCSTPDSHKSPCLLCAQRVKDPT